MKIELPDDLIIKLDETTYSVTKGLVNKAFSKVEETENGFIYTVDFKKPFES